ncbi:MAG: hypothetical protein ACP5PM_05680 [Acidimicrobiales bacterium]
MPSAERVAIDVGDLALERLQGPELALGAVPGVQVIVLLRHRH